MFSVRMTIFCFVIVALPSQAFLITDPLASPFTYCNLRLNEVVNQISSPRFIIHCFWGGAFFIFHATWICCISCATTLSYVHIYLQMQNEIVALGSFAIVIALFYWPLFHVICFFSVVFSFCYGYGSDAQGFGMKCCFSSTLKFDELV